jgi:hypothetical protein
MPPLALPMEIRWKKVLGQAALVHDTEGGVPLPTLLGLALQEEEESDTSYEAD